MVWLPREAGAGVSGVAATDPNAYLGNLALTQGEILSQNPKTYLRNQVLNLEIFMFFYNTNQFI